MAEEAKQQPQGYTVIAKKVNGEIVTEVIPPLNEPPPGTIRELNPGVAEALMLLIETGLELEAKREAAEREKRQESLPDDGSGGDTKEDQEL